MLKDTIVTVGVGQCGANMVMELEKLDFQPFYINTSLEDLETIDTDIANKYHITGTKGMAKDKQSALECITSNNNAENIAYAIYDRYAMAKIIIIFFSLPGGTGGTMGNVIAEQIVDLFPEKIVNVVAVKGKSSEDVGLQANAIESLKTLTQLQKEGVINQIHLLDNDSRDNIFSINKDFATCFDRFVSFDEITEDGNLDEEEKERLLVEAGMAVMVEFSDEDFANGLSTASDQSIYCDWFKDPKLHGLILNDKQNLDINKELIKEVLGMPMYTHDSTWEQDSNVLLSTGMSFNENILINMKKNASELLAKKKKLEEEAKQSKLDDVEFDTSAILSSVSKKKTATRTIDTSSRRRRRGNKSSSSIIDRYRKM